ncbi:MAG: HAMP domain-containing histidine kinase [Bdellovibrionaceae bacterium]|nr:HAMP domain-containing histidine kinase [Pseudobdellovibrionaceae bacterium]
MENIDFRLLQTASVLRKFKWNDPQRMETQKVEEVIYSVLGPDEVDKFFIVRSADGRILLKNKTTDLLRLSELRTDPKWLNVVVNETPIRVLNLHLPENDGKILQVGMIVKDENSNYSHFYLTLLFLSIGALGFLSSWLLSGLLFSPINQLGQFLSSTAKTLDNRKSLPGVPGKFYQGFNKNDELKTLANNLDTLLNKINNNNKMSRLWAAQMAHELKTPLTQLMLHLENQSELRHIDHEKSFRYIHNIKNIINSFLDWAELENSSAPSQHASLVPIKEVLVNAIDSLTEDTKQRVHLEVTTDLSLPCNVNHLAQLIQNLISNALKYSQGQVEILVNSTSMIVSDHGSGFPENVIKHLGEPFNFGNSATPYKGHGLGLAWVKTICHLYHWRLDIDSTTSGTRITVDFSPKEN